MNITKLAYLVVIPAMLLQGCAGLGRQALNQDSITPETAAVNDQDKTDLPDIELSQDLLYQILTAEFAVKRGHYEFALENFLQLATTTRDPRLAKDATRLAIFLRDNNRALDAAKLWVELDGNDPEARQAITAAYIRNDNPDAALEHMEKLLSLSSVDQDQAFMMLASLLSREQDLKTALLVMERFIEKRKDNPAALYAYSHLAVRAGELDDALTSVDDVLKLKPDWVNAILLRARILELQNKRQQATRYLAGVVRGHPRDLNIRLSYARVLVDAQRYKEAVPQYEKVIKQSPDNGEVLFTLGLLNLQLNNLDDAERYLERVDELGIKGNEANFYLARIEEFKENYPQAIKYYSLVNAGENYFEARTHIAILTAQQGDLEEARSQLHLLQSQFPAKIERLVLIEGDLLRESGSYDEAINVYNAVLEESPENKAILYARALTAEKLDRLDLLEQDLKKIIELDPDNIDALNALGYTLADRTDRYEEAYGYIKRAYELKPQNNAILDSMGWVLYRLGNYTEAVKYLRESLSLHADAEVSAHLGEVLWVMGDQEDAREIWEQALKLSPGDKIVIEVMERFGKSSNRDLK
jgi:tetratricopeptide (TPR) repeat protein